MSLVDDGTGPLYDRPSRPRTPAPITMDSVRAPEPPAAPTDWERYQALLADGADDAEARTTIWPDAGLFYVEDENGDQVLLPAQEDGTTDLSGYEFDPDPEAADADDETGAPAAADAEEAPEDTEDVSEPQTGAEDADPEEAAEVAAAAVEIEDGLEAEPEPEKPADEGYDPSAGTVAEVKDYLDAHPDQADFVLDRERAGKARVSLIGA